MEVIYIYIGKFIKFIGSFGDELRDFINELFFFTEDPFFGAYFSLLITLGFVIFAFKFILGFELTIKEYLFEATFNFMFVLTIIYIFGGYHIFLTEINMLGMNIIFFIIWIMSRNVYDPIIEKIYDR